MDQNNYHQQKKQNQHNTKSNGRVDLLSYSPNTNLTNFTESTKPMYEPTNQSIRYQRESSPLNIAFFSKENKQIIQNAIKAGVYKSTGYLIDNQSDIALTIVMTSTYYTYAEHNEESIESIRNEIQMLNDIVANYSISNVTTNVLQYIKYKHDVSTLPIPLEHPENLNVKGEKILMLQKML